MTADKEQCIGDRESPEKLSDPAVTPDREQCVGDRESPEKLSDPALQLDTSLHSAERYPAAHAAHAVPRPQTREKISSAVFFTVFCFEASMGILKAVAAGRLSISSNGGFPIPFVPNSMFSGTGIGCAHG